MLFNKDTVCPNVEVKSLYLHDTGLDLLDQVMEGDLVWVLQGVLSRALISSTFSQRPENFYGSLFEVAISTPENV